MAEMEEEEAAAVGEVEDEASVDEIRSNLAEYEEQLAGVDALLEQEPGNAEYLEVRQGLVEVVALTRDLLQQAVVASGGGVVAGNRGEDAGPSGRDTEEHGVAGGKSKKNIKKKKELTPEELANLELPARLRVLPTDTEDEKAKKRKQQHAFKSRQRMARLEVEHNSKATSWKRFQTGKANTSKKAGFLTGTRKGSIFATPDNPEGKVGVTGSGKPMTDFAKRDKYVKAPQGADAHGEED
eukprot:jgi/Chlat1/990/Chrsp108S01415